MWLVITLLMRIIFRRSVRIVIIIILIMIVIIVIKIILILIELSRNNELTQHTEHLFSISSDILFSVMSYYHLLYKHQ